MKLSRRSIIKAGIGFSASFFARPVDVFAQAQPLLQKKIPSTGESIPIIGIGTARRYEEVKTDAEKVPLRETIRQFQALGGKVIDSSPSYGTAEAVVGELVDGLKIRDSLFLATKVSLRKRRPGGRHQANRAVIQKIPHQQDRFDRGAQLARHRDSTSARCVK